MSNKTKESNKDNKICEIDDHIRKNFLIKRRLGKGAYGIVWKAVDRRTEQTVAVKKIFDAFINGSDAQRTFREIMFLRAFRNHPNIVQLYSIHKANNNLDIYLSFEYMESDLHNVIRRGSILKDIHKRYIMYQLLNATNFIHSGNVIHRDMKPSNILIDSKCRCKLADFGLARSLGATNRTNASRLSRISDNADVCLTDYVATRWYRAPEILVASKKYTKGIDMWSLGCILGEMMIGKPLFPGSCTINQVERIVTALPQPTDCDIKAIGNGFGSILLNPAMKTSSSTNPKLDELLLNLPNDAKSLIKHLLMLDPVKRLTAKQALNHKYVEKFRNSMAEIELTVDVIPYFRDDVQLSISEYRSKLYDIMSSVDTNKRATSKSSTELTENSSNTFSSSPASLKSDTPASTSADDNSSSKQQSKTNRTHFLHGNQTKLEKKPITRSNSTTFTGHQTPKLKQVQNTNTLTKNIKKTDDKKNDINQKYSLYSSCYKGGSKTQSDHEKIVTQNTKSLTMPLLSNVTTMNVKKNENNANSTLGRRRLIVHSNSLDGKLTTKMDGHYELNGPSNNKNFSVLCNTHKNENHSKYEVLCNVQPRCKTSVNQEGLLAKYLVNNGQPIVDKKAANKVQQPDFEANSRLRTLENKIRNHKTDVLKFLKGHTKQKTLSKTTPSNRYDGDMYVPNGKEKLKLSNYYKNPSDIADNMKRIDYAYPKLNVENLRNSKQDFKWLKSSLNNYGVISATDFSKLRTISNAEY